MIRRLALIAVAALALAHPALAQSVILVRHAERADTASGGAPTMASDPDLSKTGHARAARLARILRDAGITAIYVSEFKRTQQTAAPLAKAIGVTPTVIRADESADLLKRLRSATGHVLVVGHSNTVPGIAAALAGVKPFTIEDGEYDNLLVVSRGSKVPLLRLRY